MRILLNVPCRVWWCKHHTTQIACVRQADVGPPAVVSVAQRWHAPLGQRNFGQWALVGATADANVGSMVGQRRTTSGWDIMRSLVHRWPNVGPPAIVSVAQRWHAPLGQRHFGHWANVGTMVDANVSSMVGQLQWWQSVEPLVAVVGQQQWWFQCWPICINCQHSAEDSKNNTKIHLKTYLFYSVLFNIPNTIFLF